MQSFTDSVSIWKIYSSSKRKTPDKQIHQLYSYKIWANFIELLIVSVSLKHQIEEPLKSQGGVDLYNLSIIFFQ